MQCITNNKASQRRSLPLSCCGYDLQTCPPALAKHQHTHLSVFLSFIHLYVHLHRERDERVRAGWTNSQMKKKKVILLITQSGALIEEDSSAEETSGLYHSLNRRRETIPINPKSEKSMLTKETQKEHTWSTALTIPGSRTDSGVTSGRARLLREQLGREVTYPHIQTHTRTYALAYIRTCVCGCSRHLLRCTSFVQTLVQCMYTLQNLTGSCMRRRSCWVRRRLCVGCFYVSADMYVLSIRIQKNCGHGHVRVYRYATCTSL